MLANDIQEVLLGVQQSLEGTGLDIVSILSAFIAIFSAFFAWRQTRRQNKLTLETMRRNLDDASLKWGHDAIQTLAECSTFVLLGVGEEGMAAFETRRRTLMSKLSALVDQGRLYFPNIELDGHGAEKETAFQGLRPPILDVILYVHYELESYTQDEDNDVEASEAFISSCRRLLVSELQSHLDPKTRNAVVERFNHRIEDQRDEALYRAGKLGLELNKRRPGLLTHKNDTGWTQFAQDVDKV